jgi:hypothetical protein
MAKDKYPQYRVSQWVSGRQSRMAYVWGSVHYGVQVKRENGGEWSLLVGKEPMFFNSPEEAQVACDVLSNSILGVYVD